MHSKFKRPVPGFPTTNWAALAFACIIAQNSVADEFDLRIDPSRSQVTVNASFGGIDAIPQDDAGTSNTSTLGGLLSVDIDSLDNLSRLEFLGATVIPENNGDWLPAATPMDASGPGNQEPANIALMFDSFLGTGWGAIRNLEFSIESLGAEVADGQFAADSEFFAWDGYFDFYVDALGPPQFGRETLAGSLLTNVATEPARVEIANGEITVTLPLAISTVTGVTLELTGQLVASARIEGGPLGDFDGDGQISANDIDLLTQAIRNGSQEFNWDLDEDGSVDAADRQRWIQDVAKTSLGDANLDQVFDSGDLVTVFQAGQYEDAVFGNSGWATGDWDGNGDFESGDIVAAFSAGGYVAGAKIANVPEPGVGVLFACFALIQCVRQERRDQ